MVNRDIDTILWLVLLVSAFFFGPDVCLAGRVELLHDAGPRQVMAYWEAYANPFQTQGLAVQFEPSGFPCFVREVSVFVNSTAEFRIHIVDFDQVELCEVATIGAVKPRSWATYVLPYQVEVDCDGFWVIAEITKPPEPGIGTTYEPNGGTTVYTKNWDSENGIHYTGWGGNGGNAMIRTVVDVPVQVESISNLKAGNDHLFVTFDSPMDASTLNAETITLDAEPSGRILGTYEYDDSLTRVEFTPDSSLQPGFLSLEVSTGVVDIYGNRPSSPTHRLFVVGNETDQTPPARPGDVSVQTEDAIVVRWNAVPLADAAGYYLYSGPWQPGTTEEQWLANASKTDVGDVTETPVLVAQMESHYRVGVAASKRERDLLQACGCASRFRPSSGGVSESHIHLRPGRGACARLLAVGSIRRECLAGVGARRAAPARLPTPVRERFLEHGAALRVGECWWGVRCCPAIPAGRWLALLRVSIPT